MAKSAKSGRAPAPAMVDDPAKTNSIIVGKSTKYEVLDLHFANRHGLVAGATGTGKTVTLQVLAEGLSEAGVSVFAADIKGDLSGIAATGEMKDALVTRAKGMGLEYQPDQFPVIFWDVFGEQGHPIRATISEMGPLLLSRLLQLNDTQEGVLNIAFRVADEQGLALLDLKDLRAILGFVAEHASELQKEYGNVSSATVGTVQRQLLVLENQGAKSFFGEPALDLADFLRTDRDGRGIRQCTRCRQADRKSAFVCDLPALAFVGIVRETSRGRRSREAEARVLFRRSSSIVQRCAEAAFGKDRAGCSAGPLQRRRRISRDAKSARCAGNGLGTAQQSRAACVTGVHAARSEIGQGCRGDFSAEQESRHGQGRLPNLAKAKPWFHFSKATACRPWLNAP